MTLLGSSRGNRRLASRLPCQLSAQYESSGRWHPATTIDLSSLGCRLRLGERLERGARIKVALECLGSEEKTKVNVPGEVVWSRLEGLSYQVGIRFVEEAPELQALLSAQHTKPR
jgi:hypothetical protein